MSASPWAAGRTSSVTVMRCSSWVQRGLRRSELGQGRRQLVVQGMLGRDQVDQVLHVLGDRTALARARSEAEPGLVRAHHAVDVEHADDEACGEDAVTA